MPLPIHRPLTACLALLTLLCGCAVNSSSLLGNPSAPYPPPEPPQVGDILHMPTGIYVSEAQMLEALSDARIIYVGETHDNPASHRLELAVLKAAVQRHPGRTALGLEMFTPGQQETLDRWVAGELTEKEFLKESRWYSLWQMDFALYRDLLLFAREAKIPVIGLNADKALVRTLGREGLEGLSEEQRRELPQLDMDDPYQRAMTEAIYGGHDAGNSMLEGFLRVQTLWDETMAANVAGYLSPPDRAEHRMVVMAGGNHVRYGYGIPRRVFRRMPTSYALVGSRELTVPDSKQDRLMDVQLPELPLLPYDYLVFTEYEELETGKAQLGVQFEASERGLSVLKVVSGSAAEAAGLREGDVLLSLDGEPMQDSFDLVYEIGKRQPGDDIVLILDRDGEELTLLTTLKGRSQKAHSEAKD